jgi:hypothetical protein
MAIQLTPFVQRKYTHPFKIDFTRKVKGDDIEYKAGVIKHSVLYSGAEESNGFLNFQSIEIKKIGEMLDITDFPSKNAHILLVVTVDNLRAKSAEIKIASDADEDSMKSVKFSDSTGFKQTEARVILGSLIFDIGITPVLKDDNVKTAFVSQFVSTNLIMTNMVLNGVPIVYPVPFSGSKLKID